MEKQTKILILGTKNGLGKTTLAQQLAQELGLKYIDGDYLKPDEFKKIL